MSELLSRAEIIDRTTQYIQDLLRDEGTGHDWWHIKRVRDMALFLADKEGADLFVVEVAALLHDIADHKFHDGDENIGPAKAREWLHSLNADDDLINEIVTIIREVSFKGAHVNTEMSSIEGQVVQDADRLDALGAIGIGRAFAYGGYKERPMYDPDIDPVMHHSFEAYKKEAGPTVNHFYEKLFLLKDRMNTSTAKKIARRRHNYMKDFIDTFMSEWNFNTKNDL
ncbi:HD domain-containing protein [Balneola sp. MJW-20]|uniref:HD domain-containing protein n=1 Tax=Gracilimonas aurantiaca TaxID=3234185 RepID=UPI0034667D46